MRFEYCWLVGYSFPSGKVIQLKKRHLLDLGLMMILSLFINKNFETLLNFCFLSGR